MKAEPSASAPVSSATRAPSRPGLSWWLPALAAWLVAWLLQRYAIEPAAIGHACDLAPWSGWCAPRSVLMLATMQTQALGWVALAAGVVAVVTRRRASVQLALVAGMAGLVLYSVEPAAVGALLGALVSYRLPAPER